MLRQLISVFNYLFRIFNYIKLYMVPWVLCRCVKHKRIPEPRGIEIPRAALNQKSSRDTWYTRRARARARARVCVCVCCVRPIANDIARQSAILLSNRENRRDWW